MIQRSSALAVDLLMCASMNFVQSRHRLNKQSRGEMERYVTKCETLSPADFYAITNDETIAGEIPTEYGSRLGWRSPLTSGFAQNVSARPDLSPWSQGWSRPTVLMLHALMSASQNGYRRWARHFNERGWNACFVHLPYHYSRVPPGYWNGELAI